MHARGVIAADQRRCAAPTVAEQLAAFTFDGSGANGRLAATRMTNPPFLSWNAKSTNGTGGTDVISAMAARLVHAGTLVLHHNGTTLSITNPSERLVASSTPPYTATLRLGAASVDAFSFRWAERYACTDITAEHLDAIIGEQQTFYGIA
jgi:hypothetical protein